MVNATAYIGLEEIPLNPNFHSFNCSELIFASVKLADYLMLAKYYVINEGDCDEWLAAILA